MYYADEIDIKCFKTNKNLTRPEFDINIENPIERATFIFKKGYLIQQQGFFAGLHTIIEETSVLQHVLTLVYENLSHWEDVFFDSMLDAFGNIFSEKAIPEEREDELLGKLEANINQILKILITGISKKSPKEVEGFIVEFQHIVDFLASRKKKITISQENIDFANNIGSFGKSTNNRRYSVFFCVGFLRINKAIIDDLIKRLTILESDYEFIIRTEISFHLRFLIKEKTPLFLTSATLNLIKSYLNEEDVVLNSQSITTVLENFELISSFNPSFITFFENRVLKVFETGKDEIAPMILIAKTLCRCIDTTNEGSVYNPNQSMVTLLTVFFEHYYLDKDEAFHNLKPKLEFLLAYFNSFSKTLTSRLKMDKLVDTVNNLLLFIIQRVFHESEMSELNFSNDIPEGELDYDLKPLFYENICKILEYADSQEVNKYWMKIFEIFEDNDHNLMKLFIDNLEGIIQVQQTKQNEVFFLELYCVFDKIDSFLDEVYNITTTDNLLKALLSVNFSLYKDKNLEICKHFSFKYLQGKCGLETQKLAVKVLVKCIKYGNKSLKKEIIKHVEREILNKKGFYSKRIFFEFFSELVSVFSFKFIESIGMVKHFYQLFLDPTCSYFLYAPFKLLETLIPIASDDFSMEVTKAIKAIKEIEKNNRDMDMVKAIENYEGWYSNYTSNKFSAVNIFKKNQDKKKLEEEANLLKLEEIESKEKEKSSDGGSGSLEEVLQRIKPKKQTEKIEKGYVSSLLGTNTKTSSSIEISTGTVKKGQTVKVSGKLPVSALYSGGSSSSNSSAKPEYKKKNSITGETLSTGLKSKMKDFSDAKNVLSPGKKNISYVPLTKKASDTNKPETSSSKRK